MAFSGDVSLLYYPPMDEFFRKPILKSPYEYPRHSEVAREDAAT